MNSGIKVFGRKRKLVLVLKKLRVWGSWDSTALDQNDLGKCFSSAIRPKMFRMC